MPLNNLKLVIDTLAVPHITYTDDEGKRQTLEITQQHKEIIMRQRNDHHSIQKNTMLAVLEAELRKTHNPEVVTDD